jgi:hypothetical protein
MTRQLSSFLCSGCGYGARAKIAPERCPMCGGSTWEYAPWRPFSALEAERRDEEVVLAEELSSEGWA